MRKIYYLKNDIISNAINYCATWWAKVIKSCIWNKKKMLGCYKYAARPVLVVMASARNMTREMKNLQELKEEDWEARDEKFIFTPPTETQRARDTCFQSVIGGESNLLWWYSLTALAPKDKYTSCVLFLWLRSNCIWSQNIPLRVCFCRSLNSNWR